ncbi:MAG: hypothetical protein ABIT83_14555 [Massilia sp.]
MSLFLVKQPRGRAFWIAGLLLLHLMVLSAWQVPRRLPDSGRDAPMMQWINIIPKRPVAPVSPVVPAPIKPARTARAEVEATPRQAVAPTVRLQQPAVPETPQAIDAPAPAAALSADQRLELARRAIGKIDKDLRKQYPGKHISAPLDTKYTRLARGMQDAADAVPNRWFEAPKVTEVQDPGQYGRRRYRVVGAMGTYCITIESNHAPDGIDTMKNGIKPKLTNCEKNELPPSVQVYEK